MRPNASILPSGQRKDLQMRRHVRSIRRLPAIAAAAGLTATIAALIVTAAVPAATTGFELRQRGPHLSRDDGLGRSRVRQELQPVHGDGPAERRVRARRLLRAAHRHERRRRRPPVSVARAELEVEQRQQDPDAQSPARRQVERRQAAHVARRRLQPDGRPAGQVDGHDRPHASRLERRVDQRVGPVQGRHQAEDGRLAVHRRRPQRPVHRAAAHLVEGRRPVDVHEPEPGRLGPVREDRPLLDAGLRARQEPDLLEGGRAEDPVPRVRAGRVERRSAAR